MASTAKWLTPLAKAAGRSAAGVYYIFNRQGYMSPYTSELKGLTILRGMGLACRGYKPTHDAVGAPLPPLVLKVSAKQRKEEEVASKKKHGKWSDRLLLTRLAKLLPEGATKKGKAHVRWLLKKQGIKKAATADEAKAVEIMRLSGFDTSKFQYAKDFDQPEMPGETPSVVTPAIATEGAIPDNYDALLSQFNLALGRIKTLTVQLGEREKTIAELEKSKALVRAMLLQYERALKVEWNAGRIQAIVKPLDMPLAALNEIR